MDREDDTSSTTRERVAFIGLGVMGFPMAGHLARFGHEVVVFNRTASKAEAWVAEYGGRAAATPAEAAEGASFVCFCVGRDEDVREVVTGAHGALAASAPGTVLIDHTSASASLARELAERAAERDVAFLDAPVSGGQSGAEKGALTVMVGGAEHAFERARPIIDAYAHCVRHLGPSGTGQLTKMVNQIAAAGVIEGLAEAVHFAKAAGLDTTVVFDVISKGGAQSWQMDNRATSMCEGRFDFGFAVDWMRKDLAIALAEAKANGAELPGTALIDHFYAEVQAEGGGRLDTSALLEHLDRLRKAP